MNEQTLEMQIHAKSQEAIQSLNKLIGGLTGVEKHIGNISNKLDKVSTNTAKNQMNDLDKAINKASNSMKVFKNLFTFVGVRRLGNTALSWLNEAIDQTEQLNLFNVVFKNIEKNGTTMYSKLGKEATRFQYKLNEAFGTNKTQTLYMQGIYQSMGENVGIDDAHSAIMSETMTKLTYDLASLYNKSEKTTAEAIRAGVYAGQTKPLRSYGIDVTQTSMQPILESLGITDRSVKELSQAEKEILRYLATLKQAQVAMGDLASTIESPSNQLKILRQQLAETKVAISSLFMGTFANVLPYANAFLMVIKETSKAIADMFGIKLSDYNSGIASSEDSFIDFGDSVDSAKDKVKELKRQVLGFDEIHNINRNKDNGSEISGGIDQRLLDAIKGYDNGMDKVRMKATEIRDRIMEWLGFTKEIDPLTGAVNFKYQGIKTTLKNMWSSFKGLNIQGKILVGLGLVVGATKLWSVGGKLLTVFGSSGLVRVATNLLSPTSKLLKSMKEYIKYSPSFITGIKTALSDWNASATAIDKFKVGLVGVIGLSMSLDGMSNSMKNVSQNGVTFSNTLTTITSGLGSVASGAVLGTSVFPGLGTILGAVGGAFSSLITAIVSYNDSVPKAKSKTDSLIESLTELEKKRADSIQTGFGELEMNSQLLVGLEEIIDSNGKVKKGYEDRANFILGKLNEAFGTEYELTGNQITLNGEAITSYSEIKKSIEDVITQKKIQLSLQVFEEDYVETLKKQKELQKEINERTEIAERQMTWYENALAGVGDTGGYSLREIKKGLQYSQEELEKLNGLLDNNNTDLEKFSDIFSAYSSGNIAEIEKILNEYGVTLNTATADTSKNLDSLQTKINDTKNNIANALNGLKPRDITIGINVNTYNARKSLNDFGNELNKSGLGINFTPFNIKAYANGGMPEDGLFFANHKELVGKFSNGRTAVANNEMIVEGIKAGVYEAVAMAMSQYGSGQANQIDVHVHTDEGTVIDRIEQKTKQTGVFPFTIPTY